MERETRLETENQNAQADINYKNVRIGGKSYLNSEKIVNQRNLKHDIFKTMREQETEKEEKKSTRKKIHHSDFTPRQTVQTQRKRDSS